MRSARAVTRYGCMLVQLHGQHGQYKQAACQWSEGRAGQVSHPSRLGNLRPILPATLPMLKTTLPMLNRLQRPVVRVFGGRDQQRTWRTRPAGGCSRDICSLFRIPVCRSRCFAIQPAPCHCHASMLCSLCLVQRLPCASARTPCQQLRQELRPLSGTLAKAITDPCCNVAAQPQASLGLKIGCT